MSAGIKCCRECVPPKRYPGCGAKCEEYKEERAALDARNEMIWKAKVKQGLSRTGKLAKRPKWET